MVSFVDDKIFTRIKNHDSNVLVAYWNCCLIDDGDDGEVDAIIACVVVLIVELVEC